MRVFVEPGSKLCGRAEPPPDKSIAHRALIFAGLAEGTSRIFPWRPGADNRSTQSAMGVLGAKSEGDDVLSVEGVGGFAGLPKGQRSIDCGNSGTTMRLLAGLLAAADGVSVQLTGDASLSRRPMDRLQPIMDMGGQLTGRRDERGRMVPPLLVEGRALQGGRFALPIASAQVKSAVLLAGLNAQGPTAVEERAPTRDHTERMLAHVGVALGRDGGVLSLAGPVSPWSGRDFQVVPDFSGAAFLCAAGWLCPGSALHIRTGLNPTRTGFLDVAKNMGVRVPVQDGGLWAGEPVGEIEVEGGATLRATTISGDAVVRAIDELPLLAVLASCAEGTTQIRGAAELRVKESDRIATTCELLRAFGIKVTEREDGMDIEGGQARGTRLTAPDDHRLAMCAICLALAAAGTSEIDGLDVINVSYPGFVEQLAALGARVRVG